MSAAAVTSMENDLSMVSGADTCGFPLSNSGWNCSECHMNTPRTLIKEEIDVCVFVCGLTSDEVLMILKMAAAWVDSSALLWANSKQHSSWENHTD